MYAEPPFCGSKKCAPRRRSKTTMISEAVSGGRAMRICTEVHSMVQVKNGTLRRGMPGQRMARMVATKLTAAATVPMPLTIRPRAKKSAAGVRAKVCSVRGE
jgi:hypothetical protein